MIKIFETGDNHFGRKYDRYPEVREKLIQSRFDCLRDMVCQAEKEKCDFFVVTGDLFDNVSSIKKSDIKSVIDILNGFSGRIIILPGNHDYYTGEEKLWNEFEKELSERDYNIVLLKEFKEYSFDAGDENVIFYPAYCHSKHSAENNLGWIKNMEIVSDEIYRVGIAHGALKGITPDMNGEYFSMSESELEEIPMDVWLIGHTHIPYPSLSENRESTGYRIYNAGTHEQTDLKNDTKGYGFVISIDYKDKDKNKIVSAHSYKSGQISYFDKELKVFPDSDNVLRKSIKGVTDGIDEKKSVLRLRLKGSVRQAEYEIKSDIYKELLGQVLAYEIDDDELSEEITVEKIDAEFPEFGFAANLLKQLMDDPKEVQMAYNLLMECKE